MIVRRAGVEDAHALVAISRQTFAETFGHLYDDEDLQHHLMHSYQETAYRDALASYHHAAWLLNDADEQTVGFAYVGACGLPHEDVRHGDQELKRLYVLADHQNQGWGNKLFQAAEQWMLMQSPHALWIGVYSENTGAQRFYQRHGYQQVGTYFYPVGETRDWEFILRKSPP